MNLRKSVSGPDAAAATGGAEATPDQRSLLRTIQLLMIGTMVVFVTVVVAMSGRAVALLPIFFIGAVIGRDLMSKALARR